MAGAGAAIVAAVLALLLGRGPTGSAGVHPLLPHVSIDLAAAPNAAGDPCGMAIDARGDVYVSSRSGAAIYVFGRRGEYLGEVRNPHGPCGVAVDSRGRLYVSETATGEVVEYAPRAFPFKQAAAYGRPFAIDASGSAAGIAVDPYDQSLFVAEGDRVSAYNSRGVLENGEIGLGELKDATAVGAYTYDGTGTRFVFAAEPGGGGGGGILVFRGPDLEELSHEATIGRGGAGGKGIRFGRFGPALGVDRHNGHLYVYDARRGAIDEFQATGSYVSQIDSVSFREAAPAAIAVDRAGGADEGDVFVTAQAAKGARLLAFAPLGPPSRARLPAPSFGRSEDCGVAVDSHGDVYVAKPKAIGIYGPEGHLTAKITDRYQPCDPAVDSAGNVYAAEHTSETETSVKRIVLHRASSYPPTKTTRYAKPKTIVAYTWPPRRIAVDPRNDRLFVTAGALARQLAEYRSAAEGSALITDRFGEGLAGESGTFQSAIDVCRKTGDVYVAGRGAGAWRIWVLNPRGTKVVTAIDGGGSPLGPFEKTIGDISVDQSDCNVLVAFGTRRVEEFEAAGAFVAEFGPVGVSVAMDNGASSPNRGDLYTTSAEGLSLFGPLAYPRLTK